MKKKWILTIVWLASFVLCLCLVESFFYFKNGDGIPFLLSDDRVAAWRPVRNLYFPYLSGVLAFWFIRPFPPAKTLQAGKRRFTLAICCTLLFNVIVLFIISQVYWNYQEGTNAIENINDAVTMAAWFSFVVAPVNAFYFGGSSS
ncbi:hypothetical protein [Taibaiella chishuiensis]|uniref:Uncharacterized protein n=1 Tax=Taibaiella chishuiensis TaxID=1434707 RepID=A0A2P8CX99_9BACT|nr:hypothetical protein [Taibaiella chishuiensis]PSK89546.1 hypothetical protein B0I18_111102 [Taibaiella chishuiensis]